MTDPHINDLRTLFLYLSNAVMCIPEEYQVRVFRDMAFKLHEWNDVPISVLRETLKEFDIEFNDMCSYCGEDILEDGRTYCSDACTKLSENGIP
jgi:hypothetical protein